MAARHGHERVVQVLLDSGANTNAQQEKEGTALHVACKYGHENIVRILLDRAADVNASAVFKHGRVTWTSLDVALSLDHMKIVRLLLDRGALTEQHIELLEAQVFG